MIRECMRDRVHQNQRAPLVSPLLLARRRLRLLQVPGLADSPKLPSTSGQTLSRIPRRPDILLLRKLIPDQHCVEW